MKDKLRQTADTPAGRTDPALIPTERPTAAEASRMRFLGDGRYAAGIYLRYELDVMGHTAHTHRPAVVFTRTLRLNVPYAADEMASWWEER